MDVVPRQALEALEVLLALQRLALEALLFPVLVARQGCLTVVVHSIARASAFQPRRVDWYW